MQIIENLIEKYEWAINLYIIGGIVTFVLAAMVIAIVAYNMIKITKPANKSQGEK